jgi:hypothetical protein
MKIALVHDYLTQPGGAERVFELLCKRYPDADIFTSLYDPERTINLGIATFTQLYCKRFREQPSISD